MAKTNKNTMKNKTVERIAISAIIVAIIALMVLVPPYIGMIPLGFVSITIVPAIVLFFAWMFGWKEGTIAGLTFGVCSFIKSFIPPFGAVDVFFQNPSVSILPRLIFGFIAGISFDLLRLIKRTRLRFWMNVINCLVMGFVHTALTLTMLFLVTNPDKLAKAMNLESINYATIAGLIIAANSLIENSAGMVLTTLLIIPLDRAFPKYEAIYHGTLRGRKNISIYETITKNYQESLFNNLSKFVAIKSVYDESTVSKENPFGKGVSKALKFVEDLAKQDGFEVTNYDNKVVEILVGEGKNITILAHADVVPEGTGWDQDPFMVVDRGDYLTGRGVADDKGPLLCAYYAMKAIRDNHMMGNYQIRFIVGGNEESGSKGVEHYFQKLKKPQPNFGFSPDAEYPLIFGEKGIINFEVKRKFALKHVHSIHGGVASNSVIEKCVVVLDYDPEFVKFLADRKYNMKYEKDDKDLLVITFLGKAAHGASPEEGFNAGMAAIEALGKYYEQKDLMQLHRLFSNLQGYGLDAYGISEDMGHNTVNVGIIDWENKSFSMVVNFRYVDTCDPEDLKTRIKEMCKPFSVTIVGESKLLFYPTESTLIQTLLHAYQQETNDFTTKIKAIGGGTYAKEANNVVAFGMEMPDWDSKMHSPGEQVRKADLIKSLAIYARAIHELGDVLDKKYEDEI